MKIRFNWGTGIFIAMLCFMIFILSFVYKSIAMDEYQHELVSEEYYKDELHYQEEIDKMNHSVSMGYEIDISNTKEGISIRFPENIASDSIKGIIYFQRLSNQKLDFSENIQLSNHEQIIASNRLVSGKWIIKIDWKAGGNDFLFKDSWFY